MRHLLRLDAPFCDGLPAGEEFVFETADGGAAVQFLRQFPGLGEDLDGTGVVDVVHDDVAVRSGDDAPLVRGAAGGAMEIGHYAVPESEGHAVLQVHAGGGEDAVRDNPVYLPAVAHQHEVDGIDAQVQKGPSAEFRPHQTLWLSWRWRNSVLTASFG